MGLFMDADGLPLAFDIYPGNQNEQLTLKPLENKVIRDFDCGEFIFCSDAGPGSVREQVSQQLRQPFVCDHTFVEKDEKRRP